MACILGNVDNDFVPEIVGELNNRTVLCGPPRLGRTDSS
jgi:hypothetical protein